MTESCQGCGAVKSLAALELYPYPGGSLCDDEPIEPLLSIDCSPHPAAGPWRCVTVCHECWHRLDPDMWIRRQCWERLSPVVSFDDLPPPPLYPVAICHGVTE